jgi:histidyl-tRNA synthetase
MKRLKGMRDFFPEEMILRERTFNTLKKAFKNFGFSPLESPALESWDLLSAKGGLGEEAVKDIYRFKDKGGRDLGLRFDLTVPLARIIATNPQLPKPFKRYQIGRVWRYEEIKKGRYREFWQADIDTIGVKNMEADVEVLAVAVQALERLGFEDFAIRLNNRKILDGLAEDEGIGEEKRLDMFRAIDKLEKMGLKEVKRNLQELVGGKADKVLDFISLEGDNKEMLRKAEKILRSKVGREGVAELLHMLELAAVYGIEKKIQIDFSLARGLDYYTGPIFEIVIKEFEALGSVAGGGRYDKLIEIYGGPPTPATGISFGVERIIEILKEKVKLEKTKTKLFIAAVSDEMRPKVLELAQKLRKADLRVEIDLMGRSLSKQVEYAAKLDIPYVMVVGPRELRSKRFRLRDMKTGSEKELTVRQIITCVKQDEGSR